MPGKLPAKVDKNCNSSWHFAHRKYNNNKLQLQTGLWQQKKKKWKWSKLKLKCHKIYKKTRTKVCLNYYQRSIMYNWAGHMNYLWMYVCLCECVGLCVSRPDQMADLNINNVKANARTH